MNAEPGTRVLQADATAIAAAAACLGAGGLVAFPTETVYGLGADARNGKAVARLYAAKGRPAFNPLIAHVADTKAARRLGRFNADAERLAAAFWPGPLTLVLPRQPDCPVSDLALAGLDSVAVRVPANPMARALLADFGAPVVAPSANRSGHVSPTSAAHVLADLRGRIDLVLDGGPCTVGLESTIVACLESPTLLRPGGLARAEIERVLGRALETAVPTQDGPVAPGMLSSHYAPKARLRLEAGAPRKGEALLAFGPAPAVSCLVRNLSPRGDLIEAAANLFSHLRALDAAGATTIAVMPVPHDGLGEAINDRLRRAAAPRPLGKIMNLHQPAYTTRSIPSDLLARFVAIVGEKYAITDPEAQKAYLVEMRDLYHGHTPAVLRPGSVKEVAAILKLANETRTAVVPQGGNTGLVGGQIPHNGEIVLSLTRLDKIREVDAVSNTMTVEAGVTLQRAREAAAAADRLYPQLLPSEGTCTIGGNLSTNAGGVAALAHGIARSHALGLEVVLADGRVLHNLNKLKKDNTGYDLRNLFIGAEGTLGVITAAVLRLVPRPRSVETAFAAVPSPQAAVDLLGLASERTSGGVTSFELMMREGVDAVVAHDASSRQPLAQPYSWYVLIELSSQARSGLRDSLENLLADGLERGLVLDATIAESLEQAKAFWRIREMFGEIQRHIGASVKHDISVPVAAIPAFIEEANAAVIKLIPGARPLPFGHVGDGNLHYNVTQPLGSDGKAFLARWDEVNAVVFAVVKKYGGSISAEHGVGVMKYDILPEYKDPVAIDLMRGIKKLLDPNGILNPGKVI